MEAKKKKKNLKDQINKRTPWFHFLSTQSYYTVLARLHVVELELELENLVSF